MESQYYYNANFKVLLGIYSIVLLIILKILDFSLNIIIINTNDLNNKQDYNFKSIFNICISENLNRKFCRKVSTGQLVGIGFEDNKYYIINTGVVSERLYICRLKECKWKKIVSQGSRSH